MKKMLLVSLLALFVVGCDQATSSMTRKDAEGCCYETYHTDSVIEAEKHVYEQMKADNINGKIVSTNKTTVSNGYVIAYVSVVRFN